MGIKLAQAEEIRQGIRAFVCIKCFRRPDGSENLLPEEPRICEKACSIFLNQHRLALIAYHIEPDEKDYEKAISSLVCSQCKLNFNHAEICINRESGTCPLSIYGIEVLKLIEKIVKS